MFGQLEPDWLLIADRGFYNWPDWQAAAATARAAVAGESRPAAAGAGTAADGSYLSVVARPTLHDKARDKLIAAARAGEHLDPAQAMRVRVIEYEIGDRDGDGELIALITTITDPAAASAHELARAYCQRWRKRPATTSSRPACAAPAQYCGPRARTWSARRSTATCSPTTPSRP